MDEEEDVVEPTAASAMAPPPTTAADGAVAPPTPSASEPLRGRFAAEAAPLPPSRSWAADEASPADEAEPACCAPLRPLPSANPNPRPKPPMPKVPSPGRLAPIPVFRRRQQARSMGIPRATTFVVAGVHLAPHTAPPPMVAAVAASTVPPVGETMPGVGEPRSFKGGRGLLHA